MGQSKSTSAGNNKRLPSSPVIIEMRVEGTQDASPAKQSETLPPESRLSLSDRHTKNRSIASLSKAFRNRKWRPKRRGSISASFSLNDRDIKVELMNVNMATEEELMTLAGVNRTLARNIINHRNLIGWYRKVDDLALVSGMGATKLDLIRPEICISSRRKNLSRASSKTPSMESIPSSNSDSSRISRPHKPQININTGTIFDLMGVNGINQALAARIITYRDRKGPLKNLDDLRHVGISYRRLGALRPYLTTTSSWAGTDNEYSELDKASSHSNLSPIRPNSSTKGHTRSSSVPVPPVMIKRIEAHNSSPTSSTLEDMRDIFELMSLKTLRPTRNSSFSNEYNSMAAYRVASWNLEKLTDDKISNPGVLEVVTRTILENGLSLVAVQEICDKSALKKICEELNKPRLPKNLEWRKPRGTWSFVLDSNPLHYDKTAHYLGVLYNTEEIDEILIPDASESFVPLQNGSLWQFAVFSVKVRSASWILINVLSASLSPGASYTNGHALNPNQGNVAEMIKSVIQSSGAEGAVIVGYFNAQNAQKGLGDLQGLEKILPPPALLDQPSTPASNLWMTPGVKELYAGESGTIEDGLTHLAIPNGWGWGGRATVSSPLWCTLYESKTQAAVERPI